jgi:MFS transporter, YNFM family, putative membrane transport protein
MHVPSQGLRGATVSRRELAVGMVGFCAFLGLYATQPLLPILQHAFGASKVEVSLTVSAATLGVAVAAPWVGVLADMVGRKKVIVPAVWLLGVTYLLAAIPAGLGALVFWRFVQGLLTPAVFAVTVAYVNEEWPRSQTGFVASVYVSGTVLGGFTGRFITGLVAARIAWGWAFVVLGGLSFLLAPLISSWLPRAKAFSRVADARGALRDMAGHLRNRSLLTIYAVGFTILFGLVATFTYITFYLAAPPFSLGPSALGSLFAVYLVGVVVTPLAGKWSNRLQGWKLLAIAQVCCIAGILLSLVRVLPVVVVGLVLCSSGVFVCQIVTNRAIGNVTDKARASAVGWYVTVYYLGGFVGSTVPAFLWNLGGWPACVAFIVAVLAVALVFVLTVWRRREMWRLRQGPLSVDDVSG